MRIEHVSKGQQIQSVQKSGAKSEQAAGAGKAKADQVDISETARALHVRQQQVDTTKDAVQQLPDIRAERLEAVTRRMSEGYYNRPDVIRKIADAVVRSGVIQDAVQARAAVSTVLQRMDETPDVRPERVESAKRRAAEGAYDTPEVIQKVAEEILKNVEEP
jgi:anti-sigma28 factor (negative regulator of flagellin synthesis)